MKKLDYLKLVYTDKAYAFKNTVIGMVSVQIQNDEESKNNFQKSPLGVWVEDNKFKFRYNGEEHTISDATYKEEPLFDKDEILSVTPEFHPFIHEPMETTFGILLFNIVLFWDVYGSPCPIKYVNGKIGEKTIKSLISDVLVDEVVPTEEEKQDPNWNPYPQGKFPKSICVEKFNHHMNYLLGFDAYFIRSSSIAALSPSPKVMKRKKELFEEFKDTLEDPVVFNKVVAELVKLDMEEMRASYSNTFFTKAKFISDNRKRMFIAFGIEDNPEEGGHTILKRSLEESWDMEEISAYVNSTVSGAYQRGKATGEGGADVKKTIQLVGAVESVQNNCGTNRTETVLIASHNKNNWIGSYANKGNSGNDIIHLTDSNIDSYVGKKVNMRVPAFCKEPDGNYCSTCLGDDLGQYQTQVSSNVTRIPTEFMLSRMKAYHVASVSTVKLDLEKACK